MSLNNCRSRWEEGLGVRFVIALPSRVVFVGLYDETQHFLHRYFEK
jgi:hypothetical protein